MSELTIVLGLMLAAACAGFILGGWLSYRLGRADESAEWEAWARDEIARVKAGLPETKSPAYKTIADEVFEADTAL